MLRPTEQKLGAASEAGGGQGGHKRGGTRFAGPAGAAVLAGRGEGIDKATVEGSSARRRLPAAPCTRDRASRGGPRTVRWTVNDELGDTM